MFNDDDVPERAGVYNIRPFVKSFCLSVVHSFSLIQEQQGWARVQHEGDGSVDRKSFINLLSKFLSRHARP